MPDKKSSLTTIIQATLHATHQRSFRWVFAVISLVITFTILAYLVYNQREILFTYNWQFRYGPAILSFIIFSFDLLFVSIIWGWIMNTLGKKISYLKHFRYYSISNITKRIPGTIWYIASRARLYRRDGVDYKLTSIASGMEFAISVMSGIIIILLFATSIISNYHFDPIILAAGFLFTGILIHPRVMNRIFRLFKVEATVFSYKNILQWLLAHMLVWILGGVLLFVIGNIITVIPIQELAYIIGVFSLVGVLSTTFFLLPSSFGVTEVGISLLLMNIVPAPIAVIISVLARILIIFYEILWATLSIYIKPQEDQLTQMD